MSDDIQVKLQQRVMTIHLNRPEKKNAITRTMYESLTGLLDSSVRDSEVRVILLAGAPDAFTAGNGMQDFLKNPPTDDQAPVARFMRKLAAFPKPVVAAATGIAVGIGVTMLLHCDMVYLGQSARLRLPFVNIGLCPEFASAYLCCRG